MTVVILSIGVIGFSELLNKSFTKKEGTAIVLNELVSNRNVPMDKDLQSFKIGLKKIEPKINLYGSESDSVEIFTYLFDGKDIILSLNYGIPDNANEYNGKVIILVDGIEVSNSSMDKESGPHSSEILMDKVNELKITITGNVKLWDVTFKEMNYWWN